MVSVKNLIYKIRVAFLLTPLMFFGGISAFTVVPTTQICSNPTSPSSPIGSYYIPPNSDINGDSRDDIVLNYACNAAVAQQALGGPNVYYNFLYNDPNSVIRYYSDNGSNNVFYRNSPSVVNFSVADIVSRTAFSTPATSSTKYFRIFDTYPTGHLLSTPTISTQNHVSMECNFVARQHIDGAGGAVSLNGLVYENPYSGYLGSPIVSGPFTINNLSANPNTVSVKLCDHASLSWCGDGIVQTNPSEFDNPGSFVAEECDPATQAGGVPVGVAPGNTCNEDCTETTNAFCLAGNPTIQTPTAANPSTALDSENITFTCDTVGNPGGQLRIWNNASIFSTTTLPSGNGSVTVLAASTSAGEVWRGECLDDGGNTLGFASVGGSCERSITIIDDADPTCTPMLQIGPGGNGEVGQASGIPAGVTLNYYCSFTNYITSVPPDSMNLITPLSNVPLTPLWVGVVGADSFIGYTGVVATTTPGQYTIVCNWSEPAECQYSFWVVDPSITKYQSTGANFVAPTYGITNTQNGAPSFMPLNNATRIYYRLDVQDIGGGFTGFIADTMPSISGLDYCYLDYTRTSPQVLEFTVFNGQYASGNAIIWYVPNLNQMIDVQIVYYCDIPQLTQPYQMYNTGGVWVNPGTLTFVSTEVPHATSNTVAAQYLPIPSLQLDKYQGTGWTLIGDFQGLSITNQQTLPNPMDLTGLTGIVYKIHVYNPGLPLDTINITDTFPAGLTSCQIQNILQPSSGGPFTPTGPYPIPVGTSLWSGQNFLQGDEVTIIVTCDVPVNADVYDNFFTVDVTLNGANTQFVSNTVVAEKQPTLLFVDKLQRNVTNDTPTSGQFGSGALTYRSGDVFSFQLHYGNNSSGAISDIQLVDTFPSGFLLQSSSLTGAGFSCDGASPVIFPVLVEDCTWNLGTLAVNQSGTIYLTGVMTIGTPGFFYYNTGSIYSSGVLLDQSIVQQIPNLPDQLPILTMTKRQVTAVNTGFNDSSCNPIGCSPTLLPITTQNNYYMQYVITLTNNGSGVASSVVIADLLPQGFIPIGNVPVYSGTVPGTCSNYGAPSGSGQFSVLCNPNGTFPGGGVIQITVVGQVTTDASGIGGSGDISSYVNTASVTSTTSGANCLFQYPAAPYCASNTVVATIPGAPYLTIDKYFREASAQPGDIVHFTITYQNAGSAAAQNVYILDVLPNGLNYISHLPVPPTYSGNGQFWLSGALGVSAVSGVLNVTAQVSSGFAGTGITNTAQICASNVVGCPSDSAFLPILLTTGFDIIKSAQISGQNVTGVTLGSVLTYVLDFVNNGNTSLLYYELTDLLPPTASYINGSAQASLNGGSFFSATPNISSGSLIWTCANGSSASLPNPCTLAPGGTGQVRFNVTVN